MAAKLVLSLGAMAALASAAAVNAPPPPPPLLRRGCQVPDDGVPQGAVLPRQLDGSRLPSNITVDVHFHIATSEEHDSILTDDIVDAQWQILHDTFARYDINLNLASTERVVDNKTGSGFLLYEGPDKGWVYYAQEEQDYYLRSRKGGYDELNLYFFSPYTPGASGYCLWPTTLADDDVIGHGLDGCKIGASTMPGFPAEHGGSQEWNRGHITVHETGHWFGLNHTFAGGCSATGDFVDDTPAQRWEVYGCPVGSDTCPDSPGLDPIHNYMGYTTDECTNEFTPGQKERMFNTFFGFRRKI